MLHSLKLVLGKGLRCIEVGKKVPNQSISMLQHKLKVVVDPFFGKILTKLLSIPKRPTNSDTPPGNFEMLSRLNELDLCGLIFNRTMVQVRLSFSKKKSAQVQLV